MSLGVRRGFEILLKESENWKFLNKNKMYSSVLKWHPVLVTSSALVASFTVHCHVILWFLRDN